MMEHSRPSSAAPWVGGDCRLGESGRAGAIEALYPSVRGVLDVFLDAPTWIRDGIDGPERSRRRAKKRARANVLE